MPGVRSAVNQIVQLGVESTHGTPVGANRLLGAFMWQFGARPVTKTFTPTGHKNPTASSYLYETSAGKVSGQGCFNTLIYPLSSLYGTPTPTLHGLSTTAYDWKYKPALTGPYSPTTFTLQNGDTVDAEQYAYVLFTGWGYTYTRTTELQVSGDWMGQVFTDSVTLTASPTTIAVQPITGAMANLYLDSTSAGIGGTLITQDILKVDFKASNYYGPYFPVNRANSSYTTHKELQPKNELKITFHASSAALAYINTYLRTGVKAYIRTDAMGPQIDATHSINAEMIHDVAAFMTDAADLTIVDDVYAYETTWEVAEDAAWNSGQSQALTFTNLLSTL